MGEKKEYQSLAEVEAAFDAMKTLKLAFVDFEDYKILSDAQRDGYKKLASEDKVEVIVYNDKNSELYQFDEQLKLSPELRSKIKSFQGDESQVFETFGVKYVKENKKIIHLSKKVDARKKFDPNSVYFFREVGEEEGTLGVALLYEQNDGRLAGVIEKDGFLIPVLDSLLTKFVRERESKFEVGSSA